MKDLIKFLVGIFITVVLFGCPNPVTLPSQLDEFSSNEPEVINSTEETDKEIEEHEVDETLNENEENDNENTELNSGEDSELDKNDNEETESDLEENEIPNIEDDEPIIKTLLTPTAKVEVTKGGAIMYCQGYWSVVREYDSEFVDYKTEVIRKTDDFAITTDVNGNLGRNMGNVVRHFEDDTYQLRVVTDYIVRTTFTVKEEYDDLYYIEDSVYEEEIRPVYPTIDTFYVDSIDFCELDGTVIATLPLHDIKDVEDYLVNNEHLYVKYVNWGKIEYRHDETFKPSFYKVSDTMCGIDAVFIDEKGTYREDNGALATLSEGKGLRMSFDDFYYTVKIVISGPTFEKYIDAKGKEKQYIFYTTYKELVKESFGF